MVRISRHKYFMSIAKISSKRSTCRVKVGAIAVKDNHIIMTSYNGSVPGTKHCIDVGCEIVNNHCIRTVHAEQNIITQCAKNGIILNNSVVYCTHEPCFECRKLLFSSGVKRVIYTENYKDDRIVKDQKNIINTKKLK